MGTNSTQSSVRWHACYYAKNEEEIYIYSFAHFTSRSRLLLDMDAINILDLRRELQDTCHSDSVWAKTVHLIPMGRDPGTPREQEI